MSNLNNETTVKISRWLVGEIDKFIKKTNRNKSEFPSKKTFVDIAVIEKLERKGIKIK